MEFWNRSGTEFVAVCQTKRVLLKEAHALLERGLSDGAFYLAGYAVECALKACIAKGTLRGEFPDKKKVESSHSHNLLQLRKVAGLDEAFSAQAAACRNVSGFQSYQYLTTSVEARQA